MKLDFDAALRKQGWNIQPNAIRYIPSSTNAAINAARAIAVSAYPRPEHLVSGGKAERYSAALIAYMFRISKLIGSLDRLPEWVASFKAESMQRNLDSGLRNLTRAFLIRDCWASRRGDLWYEDPGNPLVLVHDDPLCGTTARFLNRYP